MVRAAHAAEQLWRCTAPVARLHSLVRVSGGRLVARSSAIEELVAERARPFHCGFLCSFGRFPGSLLLSRGDRVLVCSAQCGGVLLRASGGRGVFPGARGGAGAYW